MPECNNAFQKLKESLMKDPVLKVADPTKPFTLQVDASDHAMPLEQFSVKRMRKEQSIWLLVPVGSYYPKKLLMLFLKRNALGIGVLPHLPCTGRSSP